MLSKKIPLQILQQSPKTVLNIMQNTPKNPTKITPKILQRYKKNRSKKIPKLKNPVKNLAFFPYNIVFVEATIKNSESNDEKPRDTQIWRQHLLHPPPLSPAPRGRRPLRED